MFFFPLTDDKPVIVVTHGDLLSVSDRARVRVHLGELLGVHPTKQIFDIPGNPLKNITLSPYANLVSAELLCSD